MFGFKLGVGLGIWAGQSFLPTPAPPHRLQITMAYDRDYEREIARDRGDSEFMREQKKRLLEDSERRELLKEQKAREASKEREGSKKEGERVTFQDEQLLSMLNSATDAAREAWRLSAQVYSSACLSKTSDGLAPEERKRHLKIADHASSTTKALQKVFEQIHFARHVQREFVRAHRSLHDAASGDALYHPKSPEYNPTSLHEDDDLEISKPVPVVDAEDGSAKKRKQNDP